MAFRRATIHVDVLYDDTISPPPDTLSLEELGQEGMTGSYSIRTHEIANVTLTDAQLTTACGEHGTDPSFFLG